MLFMFFLQIFVGFLFFFFLLNVGQIKFIGMILVFLGGLGVWEWVCIKTCLIHGT